MRIAYATGAALLLALTVAAESPASEIILTGAIRVFGNTRTRTETIVGEIPLRPGDPFSYRRMEAGRERVARLPGIDYADIRVNYDPADSSFGLNVIVTERKTTDFGPNYRRIEDHYSAGAWVSDTNWRGRAQSIYLSTLFLDDTEFEVAWERPHRPRGSKHFGVSIDAFFRDYEYVFDDLGGGFTGARITRYGGALGISRVFDGDAKVYLTVGAESVDADRDSITLRVDGDRYSTIRFGIERISVDSQEFPFRGVRDRIWGEAVGTGQEGMNILEGHVELKMYQNLFGSRVVAAAQVDGVYRGGTTIPVYRRSHAGGGTTIRGYEYNDFDGDHSLIESIELRLPLNFTPSLPLSDVLLGVELHGFYDTATLWNGSGGPDTWYDSVGGGIALLNENYGGLRIDYGWGDADHSQWHLEVGMKF